MVSMNASLMSIEKDDFAGRDIGLRVPETVSLTNGQKAELDRRLAACRRDPDEGTPWQIVYQRIRNRR